MNIPTSSINLSQINTGSVFGVAMLAKSLDSVEETGEAMIDMMEASMELSVNPHLGGNIDLRI